MARTHRVFGGIEGKFDVLRVECSKCDQERSGTAFRAFGRDLGELF
jgi:hypothetical protein